jgi:hypothetical protein
MKDLYVLAADADMEAVFRAVLARPDSLGIRPISFEIKVYWKHDAGVFREGPELLRAVPKGEFHYFLIAFDHDGSGCHTLPGDCAKTVQERMDSFTFTDRSTVVVIAPELEEWLWCHPSAIGDAQGLEAIVDPKERLHRVFLRRDKRKPRPRDYEQIVSRANLDAWNSSPSFRIMKTTLQNWFPRT